MEKDIVHFYLIIKDSSPRKEVLKKFESISGAPLTNFEGLNLPKEHTFYTSLLGLKIIIETNEPSNPSKRSYEILGEPFSKYHVPNGNTLDISHFLKRVFTINGFDVIYPEG